MAKKLTTEEFIEKARSVHGDKYDYSKTVYDTWRKIVIIGCKKHGYFEQRANGHTNGKGCKKCAGRGWTQDDFLNEACLVHGDTYDYSQSSFLGLSRKVMIICSEHGEFTQQANNHINGKGCPDCGRKQSELSRRKWTKAKALQFAQKYSTRTGFYNSSPRAYHAAKRFGFLDEICAHMEILWEKKWDEKSLIEEASKYSRRVNFQKGNSGAYSAAIKRGIIDTVCAHMPKPRVWTEEDIRVCAKEYSSRSEFMYENSGAYEAAHRMGIIHSVCEHMERASTGFKVEKSAYVYVLCCEIGEKMKVGISNRPKQRIRNLRGTTPFPFHIVEMYKFESGQDALDIESQAHKMGDVLGVVQNNGQTSREWMKFDGSIIQWLHRQHKEIQER